MPKKGEKTSSEPVITITDSLFHGLKWRNIGPFRGGRSVASTKGIAEARWLLNNFSTTWGRLSSLNLYDLLNERKRDLYDWNGADIVAFVNQLKINGN